VQTTRNWAITSFQSLPGGSLIIIVGLVDLTSTSGYLGQGYIVTFNSTHETDIMSNGFIIDYIYDSNFDVYLATTQKSWNVDSEIILQETLPLRTSYTGPLRIKFKLGSSFPGPNRGKILIKIPKRSTLSQTGGFTYNSAKKHVCKITEMSTNI
jgi:hypothetical protein